jgi:hypothetical protein
MRRRYERYAHPLSIKNSVRILFKDPGGVSIAEKLQKLEA